MRSILSRYLPAALLAAALNAHVAVASAAQAPLVVATLPAESAEVQKGVFGLLAKALQKKLGRSVSFVRTKDYASAIEGLTTAKIDIALVGATVYVKARKKGKVRAILRAVREGYADYRGALMVRAKSLVKEPEDLKGKKVAFVDENSTTGYHYPLRLLAKHHLRAGKDFTAVFAGGHDKVVEMVARGDVAAGACFEGAENSLSNPGSVKVLAYTEAVPGDPLVVRDGLDAELVRRVSELFKKLADLPEGDDFLLFSGIDKFVPATDSDYDGVARVVGSK